MRTSAKTLRIATAMISGVAAVGAQAGPHGAGFGGSGKGHGPYRLDPEARIEHMAEALDLTTEQRDKLRAIVEKSRPQARELRHKMVENRTQLHRLTQPGGATEADVRRLADAQGRLVTDMIVHRTRVRKEIDAVLTPEQREMLQQRFAPHGR